MEGYLSNIVNLKLMLYTNIVFYIICVVMIYEVLLQLLMYFIQMYTNQYQKDLNLDITGKYF